MHLHPLKIISYVIQVLTIGKGREAILMFLFFCIGRTHLNQWTIGQIDIQMQIPASNPLISAFPLTANVPPKTRQWGGPRLRSVDLI